MKLIFTGLLDNCSMNELKHLELHLQLIWILKYTLKVNLRSTREVNGIDPGIKQRVIITYCGYAFTYSAMLKSCFVHIKSHSGAKLIQKYI